MTLAAGRVHFERVRVGGAVRAGHCRKVARCSQGGTLQRVARVVVDSAKGLVNAGRDVVTWV